MSLVARPITLRSARAFVGTHHRHNAPPRGWLFGTALWAGDELVGVGIASRPVGRGLDDGVTVECVRVCTTGERNACSMLYGRLCRAAAALGYRRAITYTLASEPGTSLRAAGFTRDADLPARASWSAPSRPRIEVDLFGKRTTPDGQDKVRWVRLLAPDGRP